MSPLPPTHLLPPNRALTTGTHVVAYRLTVSSSERAALDATCEAWARACTHAMKVGQALGSTSNVRIHHRCYADLRAAYGLNANLAVRAIARASQLLKRDTPPALPLAADRVEYDTRILSCSFDTCRASLSTVQGRLRDVALEGPVGPLDETWYRAVLHRGTEGYQLHLAFRTPSNRSER